MSELKTALAQRFGENRVNDYFVENAYIDLLKIEIEKKFPLTIICTNGLSDYEMPVPERYKGREHTEILFCLPGYWDLNDKDNSNMMWPINIIQKLSKNVLENETWYGPGHTIANGNPSKPLSETMKQDQLLLTEPIVLEDLFTPIKVGDKEICFLTIIPIFQREYERKIHRGYPKWIKTFRGRNGDEILDDYRESIYKSRWRK